MEAGKSKCVVLFGAGAVIDWGGPKTICNREDFCYVPIDETGNENKKICCLTHAILECGFKCKSGITVTRKIFNLLKDDNETKFNKREINFETIIYVIEELIFYYSRFNNDRPISLLSSLFKPKKWLDDIFNFKKLPIHSSHNCKILVENDEYGVDLQRYTPEEVFLNVLMKELLDNVRQFVDDYALNRKKSAESITNKIVQLNELFSLWAKKIIDRDNILRMYTLNYDRLFKIILENYGIKVFEGFECGAYNNGMELIRASVGPIHMDINSHVHYNLHGSAYWFMEDQNRFQVPTSEFFLHAYPFIQSNYDGIVRQMDRGRNILITNIITGYQKTARTSVTPFKQMAAAFDRDCYFADKMYIVGYSFGDEHINEAIRTAIRNNKELNITIIDPGFYENEFTKHVAFELFTNSPHLLDFPVNNREHISYFDGRIQIHEKKFKDFLEIEALQQEKI